MLSLTYVGPHDEVEIPSARVVVKRDEAFEVTPELAGRGPKGDDPGEGLLAQPTNFRKATPAEAKNPVQSETVIEQES